MACILKALISEQCLWIHYDQSKPFTKPIKTLTDGASIIGGGNLTHQVKIESQDELGELGQSFNNMADDLLKSYTALQESEERYRDFS
jgi:nitrate/nitrite-specific signal transduction histidine kinase